MGRFLSRGSCWMCVGWGRMLWGLGCLVGFGASCCRRRLGLGGLVEELLVDWEGTVREALVVGRALRSA